MKLWLRKKNFRNFFFCKIFQQFFGKKMESTWSLLLMLILMKILNFSESDVGNFESKIGHCVWDEICGKNPENSGGFVNCFYNGTALPLEGADAVSEFKNICPFMLDDPGIKYQNGSPLLCCSRNQIKNWAESLNLLKQLLGRCPACLSNALRYVMNLFGVFRSISIIRIVLVQ